MEKKSPLFEMSPLFLPTWVSEPSAAVSTGPEVTHPHYHLFLQVNRNYLSVPCPRGGRQEPGLYSSHSPSRERCTHPGTQCHPPCSLPCTHTSAFLVWFSYSKPWQSSHHCWLHKHWLLEKRETEQGSGDNTIEECFLEFWETGRLQNSS